MINCNTDINNSSNSLITKDIVDRLIESLGDNNVLTSPEELYCYSYDATAFEEQVFMPGAVVLPQNIEQVQAIMKIANEYSIPVIARGAATNLSGGCVPVNGGIILHLAQMDKIIVINKEDLFCKVQVGLVTEKLQKEVEKIGLFFPPDPASLRVSTIGGNIAESSSGPRCLKYGGIKDYVLGLKVVLADGNIIETGGVTVKNVTGYNLTQLFVGSEGTLGIICEATLKLIPYPEYKKTMLAVYNSIESAAQTVSEIIANKMIPTTLELLDKKTMQTIEKYHSTGLPIDAEASLLIEVDGFREGVESQASKIVEICKKMGVREFKIAQTIEESEELWFARRSAFAAVARLKPNVVVEDATVPRSKIPEMVKRINEIASKYNLTVCLMGHAGDGNLHPNISCDLRDKEEAERVDKAVEEIFNAAIELGGTLSGEHGIGLAKSKFMPKVLNEATISLMKQIKNTLDPKNLLNPGKVW
ncbi:MAG: FAD-linked oxidase C-terminal domain-containing protein [Cyanobacteriota bacterium]